TGGHHHATPRRLTLNSRASPWPLGLKRHSLPSCRHAAVFCVFVRICADAAGCPQSPQACSIAVASLSLATRIAVPEAWCLWTPVGRPCLDQVLDATNPATAAPAVVAAFTLRS